MLRQCPSGTKGAKGSANGRRKKAEISVTSSRSKHEDAGVRGGFPTRLLLRRMLLMKKQVNL